MSDLQILAATIFADFTTVRIPRCESLWTCSIPDPSSKHLHRLRSHAVTRETFIMSCHRQHLQHRLLEQGHCTFFDRIEGGGPDGWRLHFFCRDTEAVGVLYDVGVGVCGPGSAVNFAAEQFIMSRLRQLERTDRLHSPDGWWDWDSSVVSRRHAVPSCIPIVLMVCLPKLDSVVAFDIDEARRNLRPIKS
jgi:hypothetical protein